METRSMQIAKQWGKITELNDNYQKVGEIEIKSM